MHFEQVDRFIMSTRKVPGDGVYWRSLPSKRARKEFPKFKSNLCHANREREFSKSCVNRILKHLQWKCDIKRNGHGFNEHDPDRRVVFCGLYEAKCLKEALFPSKLLWNNNAISKPKWLNKQRHLLLRFGCLWPIDVLIDTSRVRGADIQGCHYGDGRKLLIHWCVIG